MSRIGLRPVAVPAAVQNVTIEGRTVTVTGPKGELTHEVPEPLTVERGEDGTIIVRRPDEERETKALHGLTRTLVNNIVLGVTEGFTKKLEIVGTGYRVTAKGTDLEFALGFSHPVMVKAPQGITFSVETPTKLSVSRHLEAAGGRGRGEHPQDPQARALQGQGCALRRRDRAPQGRKGW